jgi:hypothetical protein
MNSANSSLVTSYFVDFKRFELDLIQKVESRSPKRIFSSAHRHWRRRQVLALNSGIARRGARARLAVAKTDISFGSGVRPTPGISF